MIRSTRLSLAPSLSLALLVLALPSCQVVNSVFGPKTPAAAELPDNGPVIFPYDTSGACVFQSTSAPSSAADSTWAPAGDLSNRPFQVVAREHQDAKDPTAAGAYDAVQLKDGAGALSWIRLEPHPGAPSKDPLDCGVPQKTVESLDKPILASTVRILPTAPACHGLDLLSGDAADVDFEPYTLLLRRFYRTAKGFTLGVTLGAEAAGPEGHAKLITIPEDEFDNCFATSTITPLPSDRRRALFDWLAQGTQSKHAPDIALAPALVTLGVDDHACLVEGRGDAKHTECRAAIIKAEADPNGAPAHDVLPVGFVHDRVVDAVHGYGDNVIAASELAGYNFVIAAPAGKSGAFTREMETAIAERVTDPRLQAERASHGYRLLRRSDIVKVSAPYSLVQMDITVTAATSAAASAPATAAASAPASAASSTADARTTREAGELPKLFALAAPSCLDSSAAAICNVDTSNKATSIVAQHGHAASPANGQMVDAGAIVTGQVGSRRIGDVTVSLTLVAKGAGDEGATKTLLGKTHAPVFSAATGNPSADDLDRGAARAVVTATDAALEAWVAHVDDTVTPDSIRPGARAYMTLLARHVASNRRVKLVTDVLDESSDFMTPGAASYPLRVSEAAVGECYTFVAATSDGTPADVSFTLRRDDGALKTVVGRDTRSQATAGVEICNLDPGGYALDLLVKGTLRPGGVVVSMFDSTPDKITDADTTAASTGSPTSAGKTGHTP